MTEEKVWSVCWLLKLLSRRDKHHGCPQFTGQSGHKVFSEFSREGCVICPKGGTLEEVKPEYLATWGPGIYHNSPHPSVTSYCFGDEIQNLSQTCKAPGHILCPTPPSFICHLSIPHCLYSTLFFFPSLTAYPLFQDP